LIAFRPGDTVNARDVASLLAATLGWEKSVQLVVEAARTMRFREEALQYEECIAILAMLGREDGIVGVAARFARTRADAPASNVTALHSAARANDAPTAIAAGLRAPPPEAPREGATAGSGTGPRSGPVLSARVLAELLAHTLGLEKAEEALITSARRLSLPHDKLDRDQASRVFEDLSQKDGLVGIAARFAKARMLLKYNAAS
jgi:hypothetical protein